MTSSPTQSVVVFSVEGRQFAVGTATVLRVHRSVEIAPLPGAPRGVRGVINQRGEILPVFDLRLQLGLAERGIRLTDHLIIAHTSRRTVALLVDSVAGVLDCPSALFSPTAPFETTPGPITEILKLDGEIVFVHDLDRFLSEADLEALQLALEELP